ncbi:MAG: DUF2079 domain-containing protein [Desulfovibrio sp.]|nr:DUF2079 domain-containing protein [Desulfovibrio sp.]
MNTRDSASPSPWFSDRFLFFWMPLIMTLCFCACSVAKIYFFDVNDWDFSYFLTQPWRIFNFHDAEVPFADQLSGDVFWAHHLSLYGFLLAPFLGLLPSPYTLGLIHALACSLTAFIVPRLVFEIHRNYFNEMENPISWRHTAFAILCIFFFFQPYLGAFNYATHYTTLASPFVALCVLFLHRKEFPKAFLCCALVCAAQERAIVGLFCIGLYAMFILGYRKTGIVLCILSTVLFFSATQFLLPFLRRLSACDSTAYYFQNQIAPFAAIDTKSMFFVLLLTFTLFLPLCGRKAFLSFLCAFPMFSMGLVSNREGMIKFWHHYHDIPTIFLICSMIFGIFWIQKKISESKKPALIYRNLTKFLLTLPLIYFVIYISLPYFSCQPVFKTVHLLTADNASDLIRLNHDIRPFDAIPEDIHIYAQSGLGPRISLHKYRYLACRQNLSEAVAHPSLIAFSPLVDDYFIGDSYTDTIQQADETKGLSLIVDNGRLRIYASAALTESAPQVIQQIRKGIQGSGK